MGLSVNKNGWKIKNGMTAVKIILNINQLGITIFVLILGFQHEI